MSGEVPSRIFRALTSGADWPGGLSEHARRAEPGSFLRHVAALAGSKSADGLIDPKLVLSWLLTHLGAGPFWSGMLVPVREAGALVPQLFTTGVIHQLRRRKWAWVIGSAGQGLAALSIVVAALTLEGRAAGAVIVLLLTVLALARSVCSVAYKDVLGKTVGQSRRGTAMGLAASVASAVVILFAGVLLSGWVARAALVVGAVALAGLLWLAAGAIFATLDEQSQPGEGDASLRSALGQLSLLRDVPDLRLFIIARCLLVGTALAPPYLVILAYGQGASSTRQLGLMVLASATASLLSSYLWGRLADRSSRRVLIGSGIAGALALMLALGLQGAGLAQGKFAIPAVLFGLMIAYHGVRQGRATYLVDMAPPNARATYTAVSNTVVGLVLLGAGAASAALASLSVPAVIGLFAALSLAGAGVAYRMKEADA